MLFNRQNEDNVITVVYRTLSLYKVKVTPDTVKRYLKPHPDYPSLKSICDLFKEISVDCYPLRLSDTELFNLNEPFIAHLNEGEGKIILVKNADEKSVTYADMPVGWKQIRTEQFLEKWTRVVLLIEPSEISGEKDFSAKRKDALVTNSIIPFLIFLFIVICGYGLGSDGFQKAFINPVMFFILLITKSTGLLFSVLLFRSELDIRTEFTDKLCHLSTNVDCNAVTESKASKVFGSISWAYIGISYFAGGLIMLFTLPYEVAIALFSVLSIAALPYPVFSVLYQGLKIKKWCPLCLSVQTVLICEFFILLRAIQIIPISLNGIILTIIVFSTIFSIVLLVKLLHVTKKEEENNYQRLMKLKRDTEVFLSQLQQGKRLEIAEKSNTLYFGNEDSKVTIIIFLSFYCAFCAKKFKSVRSIIDTEPEIKVRLVFAPPKDELSNRLTKIICSLMDHGEKRMIPDLIEKWYDADEKQKSKVLIGYKGFEEINLSSEFIFSNRVLFKTNHIEGVPAAFVNGYALPESYELEDVRYFIEEIENKLYETKNIPVKI